MTILGNIPKHENLDTMALENACTLKILFCKHDMEIWLAWLTSHTYCCMLYLKFEGKGLNMAKGGEEQ